LQLELLFPKKKKLILVNYRGLRQALKLDLLFAT
jgi:hypothetical protein